jgi:hypothetical protein
MSDFVGSDYEKHPGSSFMFPVWLPEKSEHPVSPPFISGGDREAN